VKKNCFCTVSKVYIYYNNSSSNNNKQQQQQQTNKQAVTDNINGHNALKINFHYFDFDKKHFGFDIVKKMFASICHHLHI
jgi:hypothetical protein